MTLPVVFHPIYSQLNLPKNHRFPIEKYQGLFDQTVAISPERFDVHIVSEPVSIEILQTIHDSQYIEDFINGNLPEKAMKRIGFPWTEQFVNRTRHAVAGTILTAELATKHEIAINFTGGYHHAHPDFGSGFCVFNDLVIAARRVLDEGLASRVLIFDCDVHQGDGSATCASPFTDIFTVSIHCEKNFPARKQASDLDVGVDKYITDDEYLAVLKEALDDSIAAFRPDFIIYDAGVDIHESDDLGLINVTSAGIKLRDKLVFETVKSQSLPIAAVIGGGYQRDISALVAVHKNLVDAALEVFFV